VLVDDVVTTGETADALRDSLSRQGLQLNEVA
jgi:predicted amidophosphoribosyltransferase